MYGYVTMTVHLGNILLIALNEILYIGDSFELVRSADGVHIFQVYSE
jgi:hypothetical protein